MDLKKKLLLILDLDETLVHTTSKKLFPQECLILSWLNYYVYKRPNIDKFLDFCFKNYDVAVWTASNPDYANHVVDYVFKERKKDLKFIYTSENTSKKYNVYDGKTYNIKRLKKVKKKGYLLERTLIIDDTPSTWVDNYSNAIQIEEWNGFSKDKELLYVMEYLKKIGTPGINVRRRDKREWRDNVKT